MVVIVSVSCNRRPAGMPETFPCKITVLNNGVPMPECDVRLHRSDGNGSLSIMADTDTSGVAVIRTRFAHYTATGSPEGVFKVTIAEKQIQLPPDGVDVSKTPMSWDEQAAYFAKRKEEAEKYRIVPVHLTAAATTPLEIKLEKGGTSQWSFDVKDFAGQ